MFCSCCTGAEASAQPEIVMSFEPKAALPEKYAAERFACKVERGDGEWGMKCDGWENCIQVLSVTAGKVQEYNDSVGSALQLLPGDFTLQVNGKDVKRGTLPELKPVQQAEFEVARPVPFSLKVTKADGTTWGLRMSYQQARSSCLRVMAINDGGVREHNETAVDRDQVKEQDFIVSVNGCRGNPEKMLEAFKNCSEIELEMLRLP